MKKPLLLYGILFLAWLSTGYSALGQVYPSTVHVQLKPPHSRYLSDYYAPTADNLKVTLVFNDYTEPFWEIKLRMRIESSSVHIQTVQGYTPQQPITMIPGVPLALSGPELENYFDYRNMNVQGISVQSLQQNGRLPEGLYTFCFEVLDYNTGKVLSRKSCANVWLTLSDPPRIISPACGATLSPQVTQHNFQWQLFNTPVPNAAGMEYKLFVYEMPDPTGNPLTALTNGNFLQVFESDYLQTPYFLYDLAAPLLEPGKRYFYRVQAIDPEGKTTFKNDGFSEVCSFYYGYPENGTIKLVEPAEGKVFESAVSPIKFQWEAPNNKQKGQAVEYVLEVVERRQGQSGEEAFEQNKPLFTKKLPPTTSNNNQIFSVPPSLLGESEYAGGVTAFSGQQQVAQSNIVSFSGSPSGEVPGSVAAGDNCVAVEAKITQSSNNNEYTFVNTSTSTEPIEVQRWYIEFYPAGSDPQLASNGGAMMGADGTKEGLTNLSEGQNGGGGGSIIAGGQKPQTGTTSTDTSNAPPNASPTQGGNIIFDYTAPGSSATNGNALADKGGEIDGIDFTIQFSAPPDQSYGFDILQYNLSGYDRPKVLGKEYPVAWKSVATGEQDVVHAEVAGSDLFPEEVGFKIFDEELSFGPGDNGKQKELTVTGRQPDKIETIVAYVPVETDDNGEKTTTNATVGKLNVITYDKVSHRVVVVPVNNADVPDQSEIAKALNAIYAPGVAEWDVTIGEPFQIETDKILDMDDQESGILASFPQPMRAFNRAFKDSRDIDGQAYYIFLVEGSGSNRKGFMPFKRQMGYIFTDNLGSTPQSTAIAHELAHGAFRLRHPEDEWGIPMADNLMHNTNGTALKKYQWDYVHHPEAMIGWLQGDEESALAIISNIQELDIFANNGTYTFLTPAGKGITLPSTLSKVYFSTGDTWNITREKKCANYKIAPIGTLVYFVLKNETGEVKYSATRICNSDDFTGYYDVSDPFYQEFNRYKDKISYNLKPSKYIIGTPFLKDDNVVGFKVTQVTESSTPSFEEINYGSGTLQPFDYIVSKINLQNTTKTIDAVMEPQLGEAALHFINNAYANEVDESIFPYIFTHAHQINQFSEVYRMCWMGSDYFLDDLEDFLSKQIPPTIKEFFSTTYYAEVLVEYWKKKSYSTYYEYDQILNQFKNLDQESRAAILELLKKTKDYQCLWKAIGPISRISAIKKLISETWVDDEEEQLLIALFNTVPDQIQAEILIANIEDADRELLKELHASIDGDNNNNKYYNALSNLLELANYVKIQDQVPENIDKECSNPIAHTENRDNKEDLMYGKDGKTGLIRRDMIGKTDTDLIVDMKTLFCLNTTLPYSLLDDNPLIAGTLMINHFLGNTGKTFEHTSLTESVSKSNAISDYLNYFRDVLNDKLKLTNGNIYEVGNIELERRPIFDSNIKGLKILLNDTEYTSICLKSFSIDIGGAWSAEVNITIYDHFGLDLMDALKYQYTPIIGSGFASWWLLQHKKGYRPFVTKIQFTKTIEGNIK